MKAQLTQKRRNAGLTLIEVTLVIAVLLGLISVLFIGVAAYKRGSDRAKCVLNISTVQKAARSYQNMYELANGDTLGVADIAGAGKMIESTPECPSTGTYTFGATVPVASAAYLTCSLSATEGHEPATVAGW
ncbi:MAG: type II secretory pathway pseudopilin PulG [Verrucomicrobiales bacterium]|jgi:type II secretory pathway pseudopilin PulG